MILVLHLVGSATVCADTTDEKIFALLDGYDFVRFERDPNIPGHPITSIRIRKNSNYDEIIAIQEAKERGKTIEQAIAEAIPQFYKLKSLKELSFFDYAINDKELLILNKNFIGHPNLKVLHLGNRANISWSAFEQIAGLKLHELSVPPQMNCHRGLKVIVNNLERPTRFNLTGKDYSDESIKLLAKFDSFKDVVLKGDFTDAGLRNLSGLIDLETLVVASDKMDGSWLQSLKHSLRLEHLTLEGNQLIDEGFSTLPHLPTLKTLNISCLQLGDKALESIQDLQELESIYICSDAINGSGFVHLQLPKLQYAEIECGSLDDAAGQHLSKCNSLKYLHLRGCRLTAKGLQPLRQLNLEFFDYDTSTLGSSDAVRHYIFINRNSDQIKIESQQIDEHVLSELKHVPDLVAFEANKCKITAGALNVLAKRKDLSSLLLDNSEIPDESLEIIAGFPNLRYLDLIGVKADVEGVKSLIKTSKLRGLELSKDKFTELEQRQILSIIGDCFTTFR